MPENLCPGHVKSEVNLGPQFSGRDSSDQKYTTVSQVIDNRDCFETNQSININIPAADWSTSAPVQFGEWSLYEPYTGVKNSSSQEMRHGILTYITKEPDQETLLKDQNEMRTLVIENLENVRLVYDDVNKTLQLLHDAFGISQVALKTSADFHKDVEIHWASFDIPVQSGYLQLPKRVYTIQMECAPGGRK